MQTKVVVAVVAAGIAVGFAAGRWTAPQGAVMPPAVPLDRDALVVRIGDGDTVEVSPLAHPDRREKVRLIGLNAPGKGEKYYDEAQRALAGLVADRQVEIEFEVKGVPARDEHNRVLGYLFVDDQNVNVEMVRLGWSKFSTKHGGGRFADDLNKAEEEARTARAGLWAGQ